MTLAGWRLSSCACRPTWRICAIKKYACAYPSFGPAQTPRRIGHDVHGALEGIYECLQGVQGASEALHRQIQDATDNIDKKLLRMFQSAVKAEKVVRALEVASQLTAVRSLEGAVKIANHHRCRPVQCRDLLCTSRRMHVISGQDAVNFDSLTMSFIACAG